MSAPHPILFLISFSTSRVPKIAKDINQNEDPRLHPSPWNILRQSPRTYFTSTPVTRNQVARGPHFDKYTSGWAAGLSLAPTQQGHCPPPPGSPLPLPNLTAKPEEPTALLEQPSLSPVHTPVRVAQAVFSAWKALSRLLRSCPSSFQVGVQIPPPTCPSPSQFLFPPNSTFSLYVCYYLSNFAILVYGLHFRVRGKRSQLCPPQCPKYYLWKVLNWVY